MVEMVKFPYNVRSVARLDCDNIVHNHIYHDCPVGKVDENGFVYDIINNKIGRVDINGIIYSNSDNNSPIGKVDVNGFVYDANSIIARMDGEDKLSAGSAYLLLIHGTR